MGFKAYPKKNGADSRSAPPCAIGAHAIPYQASPSRARPCRAQPSLAVPRLASPSHTRPHHARPDRATERLPSYPSRSSCQENSSSFFASVTPRAPWGVLAEAFQFAGGFLTDLVDRNGSREVLHGAEVGEAVESRRGTGGAIPSRLRAWLGGRRIGRACRGRWRITLGRGRRRRVFRPCHVRVTRKRYAKTLETAYCHIA